jgi:hypothetical protein
MFRVNIGAHLEFNLFTKGLAILADLCIRIREQSNATSNKIGDISTNDFIRNRPLLRV